MPQVSAAILRSAPSRIIAIASIRRAAEPSFSRPATIRSSAAVTSSRVIETAAPIDATPLRNQHRVRLSLIWESQNESTAGAVGIIRKPVPTFRDHALTHQHVLELPGVALVDFFRKQAGPVGERRPVGVSADPRTEIGRLH